MSRLVRFAVGVVVVAAFIVIAGWFDGTVMMAARRQGAAIFDPWPALPIRALGYLIIAGGSLAVGVAGWRLRSLGLAIAYVLGGGFFAFIDIITWKLAAQVNDAPPVLPQPIATAIGSIYFWQEGPLNAAPILGAATLIVGVTMLVATSPCRSMTIRSAAPGAVVPTTQEPVKL